MQALADPAATGFAAGSPEGKAWMATLPSLLRDLAGQWDLTTDGGLLGRGYNAAVLPVRQDGRPLALKLTWPPGRAGKEADAVAAWRARGAVELAACDAPRGALLLGRAAAGVHPALAAPPVRLGRPSGGHPDHRGVLLARAQEHRGHPPDLRPPCPKLLRPRPHRSRGCLP